MNSFEDGIALSLANFELHRSLDMCSQIKDTEEYQHYLQTQNSQQLKYIFKQLKNEILDASIEQTKFLLDMAQLYKNNREAKLNKYEMKQNIHVLEKLRIAKEENESIRKQIEDIKKENRELEAKLRVKK